MKLVVERGDWIKFWENRGSRRRPFAVSPMLILLLIISFRFSLFLFHGQLESLQKKLNDRESDKLTTLLYCSDDFFSNPSSNDKRLLSLINPFLQPIIDSNGGFFFSLSISFGNLVFLTELKILLGRLP